MWPNERLIFQLVGKDTNLQQGFANGAPGLVCYLLSDAGDAKAHAKGKKKVAKPHDCHVIILSIRSQETCSNVCMYEDRV